MEKEIGWIKDLCEYCYHRIDTIDHKDAWSICESHNNSRIIKGKPHIWCNYYERGDRCTLCGCQVDIGYELCFECYFEEGD
jgi:hypothetical protein